MKNVAIIFGGVSCEHDISIVSTFQVLKYFDEYLYNIILIYIDKKGMWRLVGKERNIDKFIKNRQKLKIVQISQNDGKLYIKKGKKYKAVLDIDVVFPILHGVNGEDGCIMGLCKMLNIPCIGCDVSAAAIGIDKSIFKNVCSDLPVLTSITINDNFVYSENFVSTIEEKIGFPCVIKPSRLGSSIGINICKNGSELIDLAKKSLIFDKKIIIEPYIASMREFNIALYRAGGEFIVSEIEEPISKGDMLSFNDKYLTFSERSIAKNIPANICKKIKESIVENAKKLYNLLVCSGVVRVDFIYNKVDKRLYINEINTIPGSLALYLFEAAGIDRKDVINQVVQESIRCFNHCKDVETDYNSAVLEKQDFSKF